jgi:putative ABC transport system substrate-binding protein
MVASGSYFVNLAYSPLEHPGKFQVVIRRGTAKALGLTIPESIRIRADEVIR